MSRRVSGWIAGVLGVLATGAVIVAQQPDEFVSITNIQTENLPAVPFVYAAYAIVWVVLMGYAFMLWRRLGRVERELGEVSARLEKDRRP